MSSSAPILPLMSQHSSSMFVIDTQGDQSLATSDTGKKQQQKQQKQQSAATQPAAAGVDTINTSTSSNAIDITIDDDDEDLPPLERPHESKNGMQTRSAHTPSIVSRTPTAASASPRISPSSASSLPPATASSPVNSIPLVSPSQQQQGSKRPVFTGNALAQSHFAAAQSQTLSRALRPQAPFLSLSSAAIAEVLKACPYHPLDSSPANTPMQAPRKGGAPPISMLPPRATTPNGATVPASSIDSVSNLPESEDETDNDKESKKKKEKENKLALPNFNKVPALTKPIPENPLGLPTLPPNSSPDALTTEVLYEVCIRWIRCCWKVKGAEKNQVPLESFYEQFTRDTLNWCSISRERFTDVFLQAWHKNFKKITPQQAKENGQIKCKRIAPDNITQRWATLEEWIKSGGDTKAYSTHVAPTAPAVPVQTTTTASTPAVAIAAPITSSSPSDKVTLKHHKRKEPPTDTAAAATTIPVAAATASPTLSALTSPKKITAPTLPPVDAKTTNADSTNEPASKKQKTSSSKKPSSPEPEAVPVLSKKASKAAPASDDEDEPMTTASSLHSLTDELKRVEKRYANKQQSCLQLQSESLLIQARIVKKQTKLKELQERISSLQVQVAEMKRAEEKSIKKEKKERKRVKAEAAAAAAAQSALSSDDEPGRAERKPSTTAAPMEDIISTAAPSSSSSVHLSSGIATSDSPLVPTSRFDLSSLIVCRATTIDAAALAEFAQRSFVETFAHENTAEDMAAYCAKAFGESIQEAELNEPNRVTFLALQPTDGSIVGYASMRYDGYLPECLEASSTPPEHMIELQRIYGRGTGALLLRECEKYVETEMRDRTLMWLGVYEKNTRALDFYRRNGFQVVGSHVFQLGEDKQTDLIMTKSTRTQQQEREEQKSIA